MEAGDVEQMHGNLIRDTAILAENALKPLTDTALAQMQKDVEAIWNTLRSLAEKAPVAALVMLALNVTDMLEVLAF